MTVRDKFWAYVTAFGTLWGGLELTLGTFLHVLHVPKTGLIMTFLSLILVLAQRHIFSDRGSTICVGIIAACIKSLSPGGIILGPVVGIIGEAILIELCFFVPKRGWLPAMIAGGLAVTWSQMQSAFNLWIYYGQDFIDGICVAIEKFFSMPWSAALGWGLLGAFFGIMFILGGVGGFLGNKLGIRVENELKRIENEDLEHSTCQTGDSHSGTAQALHVISGISSGKRKFAKPDEQILKTRLIVFPVALLSLIAQFNGDLLWSSVALFGWIAALLIWARNVLKAIWWPRFWALTVAVSLVCGLLLAWDWKDGSWQWMVGIEATARMLVRGIYVFSLIGWVTRCVRTEEFLTIWNKIHLPELGKALTNAYQLLPEWIERMNELVAKRPGGFKNNWKYAEESILMCLVDASKNVEDAAFRKMPASDDLYPHA